MNSLPFLTVNDLPQPPDGKAGWPWTDDSLSQYNNQKKTLSDPPLVSIIVPSYNQGSYIEETIRSILLQNYPNLELIIMDGGSSDQSPEIIKKYEKFITYWQSEPDNGQSDAIRKGFTIAQGSIIAWLNSDDYYQPGAVLTAIYQMQISHVSMVYGDYNIVSSEGVLIHIFKASDYSLKLLAHTDIIPQPSSFFEKEAYSRVGGLDDTLHYVMDYDLWLKMAFDHSSIMHIPCILSNFRSHTGSKTVYNPGGFLTERVKMIDRIITKNTIDDYEVFFELISQSLWSLISAYHMDALSSDAVQIHVPENPAEVIAQDLYHYLLDSKIYSKSELEDLFHIYLQKMTERSISFEISELPIKKWNSLQYTCVFEWVNLMYEDSSFTRYFEIFSLIIGASPSTAIRKETVHILARKVLGPSAIHWLRERRGIE